MFSGNRLQVLEFRKSDRAMLRCSLSLDYRLGDLRAEFPLIPRDYSPSRPKMGWNRAAVRLHSSIFPAAGKVVDNGNCVQILQVVAQRTPPISCTLADYLPAKRTLEGNTSLQNCVLQYTQLPKCTEHDLRNSPQRALSVHAVESLVQFISF